MNATIITTRLDTIFAEHFRKLPEAEKDDILTDVILYGVNLIEVRDDGSARRVDPCAVLAHLK